jgi:hypothetical protein
VGDALRERAPAAAVGCVYATRQLKLVGTDGTVALFDRDVEPRRISGCLAADPSPERENPANSGAFDSDSSGKTRTCNPPVNSRMLYH